MLPSGATGSSLIGDLSADNSKDRIEITKTTMIEESEYYYKVK